MIKGIIIGFFCFLFFLTHIFIFHNFNIKRRFYFMLKMFLWGLLFYIFLFVTIQQKYLQVLAASFIPISLFAFLNGTFLHFFFCYFYLHLIQIIDRSPSTRIMIEIETSSEKRLSLEQLKKLYSLDKKIPGKLEDMIALGRLKKEALFYVITPKGKIHMQIFKFVRDYLKLARN